MSNCILVKIRFYTWAIWVKKHLIKQLSVDTSIIKTRYLPGNPLLSDSVIFWEKKNPSKALSEATGGDRALGRGAQAFWTWRHERGGPSQVAVLVKNPPANARDVRDAGSIPGSGGFLGGRHGNPLQYSCLENPHGQRSLAGYSPRGQRVRHNWSELACMDTTQLRCWKWMSTLFKLIRSFTAFPVNPVSFQCFLFFPPKYGCK